MSLEKGPSSQERQVLDIRDRKEFQHKPEKGINRGLFRKVDTHERHNVGSLKSERPTLGWGSKTYKLAGLEVGLGWSCTIHASFSLLVYFLPVTRARPRARYSRFTSVLSASQWPVGVPFKIQRVSLFILNPCLRRIHCGMDRDGEHQKPGESGDITLSSLQEPWR